MRYQRNFEDSLFEQHWVHMRHIESERMWIMGIWLAVTGVMVKEIWLVKNPSWDMQMLRLIPIIYVTVTFAVLLIIFKLGLEYERHKMCISRMGRCIPKYQIQMKGVWGIVLNREKHKPPLKALLHRILKIFLSLGGLCSVLLIFGIFLGLSLWLDCSRGACSIFTFDNWMVICISVALLIAYQYLFGHVETKLKREIENEPFF
jgi:hypothetical protein